SSQTITKSPPTHRARCVSTASASWPATASPSKCRPTTSPKAVSRSVTRTSASSPPGRAGRRTARASEGALKRPLLALDLHIGALDHARPLRKIGFDERREFLRGIRDHLTAEHGHDLLLHLRLRKHCTRRLREPAHDRGRGARGRKHAIPDARL